ncbi:MAG: hypothetical protein QG567_510 [Campylobacterota bacterium]|nr:hypothetical protein [Campylobacterota bacterium]MDQ1339358.1 hypothetical protein [Campylobacterota bacterium]
MQKKTLFWVYLILVLVPMLSAQEHPDKGFYGSLGFLYMEDKYINGSTESTRENFTQEIKLGYEGNIYSPRLLDYTIEGLLRYDNENNQRDDYTSKQKNVGNDYRANLNFIKETKFPFTVYANKSERPINTVYNAYSTNYIYETSSEGVTGSINLEPYMFTYGVINTKTIAEFSDRLQNQQTNTYNTSFRYSEGAHNLQANYSHAIQENQQTYINDAITSVNQVKDMLNISDTWKASKDLMVNSTASYQNDGFYQSETKDVGLDLYWRPEGADYDGSLSVYGSSMNFGSELSGDKYILDSTNVNQMFNYRVTPTITLSENAMLYTYDSTNAKGSTSYVNLDASHYYDTTFFNDVPFVLLSRIGVQKNDSDVKTTFEDNSTTTSTSVERYNFDVNARVKKELPSIDSSLNFDSGYYHSVSSIDQEEQRYTFNLYLLSKLFSIVNNNISARYMQTNTSSKSMTTDEVTKNSYSRTSLMEMLDFYFNLGIKGRVGFKVGAEYENMKTNNESMSRVSPRGEMNLNYRFLQSLMFSSSARVSELYNTTEYAGNANLTFNAGKTSFLMGYQYNKSEIQSVFNNIQNERSIFRAQLTRTF